MKNCVDCIKFHKCFKYDAIDIQYRQFCIDHDMCSFEQDSTRPAYNMNIAKQLIFDCAAELYHGMDSLTKEQVANNLMDILKEMDKM